MELTEEQIKKIDDLRVQAMLFDMDIDWETASLVPKTKDETPFWIKKWKEKQYGADYDPYFDNR